MGLITYRKRNSTTKAILHDSHTEDDDNLLSSAKGWTAKARLVSLEMGLLSTGYHYIVERDGKRMVCRDIEVVGTHAPGLNLDSVGICLVGGRTHSHQAGVDNFTYTQRLEVFKIMQELRTAYPDIKLFGHTELQRYRNRKLPHCPALDMDAMRSDVELFILQEETKCIRN